MALLVSKGEFDEASAVLEGGFSEAAELLGGFEAEEEAVKEGGGVFVAVGVVGS